MKSPDELRREIDALRERISRLSAAILRTSATLDLGTVLREVVDSARALTGARYGVIATLGDAGHRRPLRRDCDPRRRGAAPGVRLVRPHSGRTPTADELVRRDPSSSSTFGAFGER